MGVALIKISRILNHTTKNAKIKHPRKFVPIRYMCSEKHVIVPLTLAAGFTFSCISTYMYILNSALLFFRYYNLPIIWCILIIVKGNVSDYRG